MDFFSLAAEFILDAMKNKLMVVRKASLFSRQCVSVTVASSDHYLHALWQFVAKCEALGMTVLKV